MPDGGKDLYIQQTKFHAQFAADVSAGEAALMAVNQRPVTEAALNEKAAAADWKTLPTYFIYGTLDKNIPPAVHAFMAQRAKSRKTEAVAGASHVVMMTHAPQVAGRTGFANADFMMRLSKIDTNPIGMMALQVRCRRDSTQRDSGRNGSGGNSVLR